MKRLVFLSLLLLGIVFSSSAQTTLADTTLYFDFDKYEIKGKYQNLVAQLAELVKSNPGSWVEISGHADIVGPKEYNQNLSLKRTEMVLKSFHKNKVSPETVKGFHYGSGKPVASNDTKEGRKKNRRVEVKVVKLEKKQEAPVADAESEKILERIEIDIHYNKQKFAYLVNSHRSVLHTIREAELIIDTNTFELPVRSNLYKSDKVRIDFSEMDKVGEMVYHRVGLVSDNKEELTASYIVCLDSLTSGGHAFIKKGKVAELLIPAQYVNEETKIYFSPKKDRKSWKLSQDPVYNSLHNCYTIKIKNEGCFAAARPVANENPVNLVAKYSHKGKKYKFKETPEFYFVYKDKNSVVAADSVSNGLIHFTNLREGAAGTLVGLVNTGVSEMFYAQEEVTIKGSKHNNKLVHLHGHIKFQPVSHFDIEKYMLSIHKEDN